MGITRTASRLAGGALVASSLALVAPAAYAAPPPGDTAVAGVATANGTPTAGIYVDLYGVNPDGTADYLGETDTGADGSYYFDFTTGLTNDGSSVDTPAGSQIKVLFGDDRALTGDQLGLHYEYYNDANTFKTATPLPAPAAGAVTTVPTVSLSYEAGIKGTISVPVPAGYYYQGEVDAYNSDDQYQVDASFDSDPATTGTGREVTYFLNYLNPNQSYKVVAYATASPISGTGPSISYVSTFYVDGANFSDATPVAVGAGGSITQPINWALSSTLSNKTLPSIVGQAAPGKTLSVDPGTWSRNADNVYTYQWLVNDAPVSTAATFTPSKSDLKKKLRVLVTARNYDFVGTASTQPVQVGYASKLKVKARKAVVKGTTVVEVAGKVQVKGVKKNKLAKALKGKITVFEGDVKVGKGKVLPGGKILVVLKGITAGKHELTVEFDGKLAADASSVEKVKV